MTNDRVELAVELFSGGLACSQAILAVYGPLFGFDRDDAIRVARGFGGGMGRLSETCGAVTGAFMAISLKFDGTDKQTKEDTYALSHCICYVREAAEHLEELLELEKQPD